MTHFDPEIHHRRSIRLRGYDYASSDWYFITLCTQNRKRIFGRVVDGKMILNSCGRIVENEWLQTPLIRREVEIDLFVVMPDHFHAIVITDGSYNRTLHQQEISNNIALQRKPKSLSSLVSGFKSAVTRKINQIFVTNSISVWQRNYYEHIIRNEDDLRFIRDYLINNPAKWSCDRENNL